MAESQIRTRLLIISDTHGKDFEDSYRPTQKADVVVHCGDITDGSQLEEYHTSIAMLKSIDAPLKLVIAGNHDFTLDTPIFRQIVSESHLEHDPELVTKFYGEYGETRRLFEQDSDNTDIIFLDQGTHNFLLQNGASLSVYASPYTPSQHPRAFHYLPEHGHDFSIPNRVDLAITHGPPKGVMDYTNNKRTGCSHLFAAIAKARPRIHCFGHIHEGWGAKLVSWKDEQDNQMKGDNEYHPTPTHFSTIDNNKSVLIERLASLESSSHEPESDVSSRLKKLELQQREKCCRTSHCVGDERPLELGRETLFINASILDKQAKLRQRPWLVDIELPRAEVKIASSPKLATMSAQIGQHSLHQPATSNIKDTGPAKRKRADDCKGNKDYLQEGTIERNFKSQQ